MPALPLTAVFADLPDPRRDTENKLHALTDVLVVATCAVIGGAETWDAIALFGRCKESFFRRFLPLANGIPSPDTFERVFAKLDPAAFAAAFGRWLAGAVESHLLLGVRSAPDGGHEITTTPELVGALDLAGAVVTIDAAGCQKATVEQIRLGAGGTWCA